MELKLGKLGVWLSTTAFSPELARQAEKLGYGTLWAGGSPSGDLHDVEGLLDATEHVVVATGIVNMWKDDAVSVANSFHRVAGRYPGRFLLGVGVGHREATEAYRDPYHKMTSYLDDLDAHDVPVQSRVLAALGPRALRLAAERAAGAHPYLTTPEHTRRARLALGNERLLCPEQKVLLGSDPGQARASARATLKHYLALDNYRRNLLRLGWTAADLANAGSDRLVDALVLHGSAEEVARGVNAHFDAGADHVCLQPLSPEPLGTLSALAEVLLR